MEKHIFQKHLGWSYLEDIHIGIIIYHFFHPLSPRISWLWPSSVSFSRPGNGRANPRKHEDFFQHVQNNAYSLPLEFYLIFFSEHFTHFPKEMLSCYLSLTSHLINLVSTKNKRDVLAIVKILLVLLKRVRRDSLDYCLQWGKIVRRSFCHMLQVSQHSHTSLHGSEKSWAALQA